MKAPKEIPISFYLDKHPKNVKKSTLIAFVMQRSKLISVGYNRRSFPMDKVFTIHAEEAALNKAGRRAKDSTMYVMRFKKDGSVGMAKPCIKCSLLIEKYKVKKVYYSE